MAGVLQGSQAGSESLKYALKSVALEPRNIENRALLAEIYSQMKDDEAAIKEYRKNSGTGAAAEESRLVLTPFSSERAIQTALWNWIAFFRMIRIS